MPSKVVRPSGGLNLEVGIETDPTGPALPNMPLQQAPEPPGQKPPIEIECLEMLHLFGGLVTCFINCCSVQPGRVVVRFAM